MMTLIHNDHPILANKCFPVFLMRKRLSHGNVKHTCGLYFSRLNGSYFVGRQV